MEQLDGKLLGCYHRKLLILFYCIATLPIRFRTALRFVFSRMNGRQLSLRGFESGRFREYNALAIVEVGSFAENYEENSQSHISTVFNA